SPTSEARVGIIGRKELRIPPRRGLVRHRHSPHSWAQGACPMPRKPAARIHIGVGGWNFAPWRGTFYPPGLAQKGELEYASNQLTSIEINSTFYGSQKPASFEKWYAQTPKDFIFSVKGPMYATNRRVLAEAQESIARFFGSGVLLLKEKLGPINWQFGPTKKFDAAELESFLALLPKKIDGRAIRHAIEVRHASF